ncbi:site-specific integrase [Streptomyces sp. R-74717]|uniref:tyrosine-type recombinase/integrase n=1 Tax=Streptomyces sp. R-74717 TaxID=2969820 RepID=UPI0039B36B72
MPFLFQRRYGTEDRPLTRRYIRECLAATSQSAQITAAGDPLEWRPYDFRRICVTDAIRSGLPPHIAAKICGHAALDTTMGYAAIYPEDVISHHRAFIARRRTEWPSEEYRELTATEWDEFLAHFELRKVALGTCGRDYASPCQHENACVRCPLLLVDPAQKPCRGTTRLYEVKATSESDTERMEFELGVSEEKAAREYARGTRYRILLITSALDPERRRVSELPNPFTAAGRDRFLVVGRGLRYQLSPTHRTSRPTPKK